jgi:hypothetical protein
MIKPKIKTTPKEVAIIRAIIGIELSGRNTFGIDEICSKVYEPGGPIPKPKWSKTSMTGTLKNLAFKLETAGGYRLRRISALGVGRKGEYEFAGDFSRLLKKEASNPGVL